jgi:hypothetical protein
MANIPFYPSMTMIPRHEFVTAGTAFTAYLFGALLIFFNRGMEAFFLLTLAVTINIMDAYTFPIMNRLSGSRESLFLGAPGKKGEQGNPEAVFFLSLSLKDDGRIRKRSLYRIGFLGGVTLYLSSIAKLIVLNVHPLFVAAGSALVVAGFFSHGLYREEKGGNDQLLEKLKTVSEGLIGDAGFGSWVIILTDNHALTRTFLARYRRFLLTTPCIFLSFAESLGDGECTVPQSLGTLTGYRTHEPLSKAIAEIATKNGIVVTNEKRGLDLNCLCALARGFRAASITFCDRIQEPLLLDSLLSINRLHYIQGNS